MIVGNPKETILVDIDRVLCEAGSDIAYPEAKSFLKGLWEFGKPYIYSSRSLESAKAFVKKNGLKVAGYVEKPNPLAIIDDKAVCCNGPKDYWSALGVVNERQIWRKP